MKVWKLAPCLGLVLAACLDGTTDLPLDRATRAVTMPQMQLATDVDPRDELVPSGTRAFVAVLARSPDDAARFRLYGVDLTAGEIVWHIDGDTEHDLPGIVSQLNLDLLDVSAAAPDAVQMTVAGYSKVPLPPPPPGDPTGDEWTANHVANLANDIHAAVSGGF